jgi:ferritin-like metal-binding protein YciE
VNIGGFKRRGTRNTVKGNTPPWSTFQCKQARRNLVRKTRLGGFTTTPESTMTTTTAREVYVVGLRNAHAMEVQARELMERQSERLTDYPDVQAKVKEHLVETNQQLKRLEQCLEACGETSSTLKDTAQSVMANTMAMAHAMAGDEILKNTFANNAFEHFEIAAYKSLLTLCSSAGQDQARTLLEQNLKEEERMAAWIDANVGKVTQDYLAVEQRKAA